MEVAERHRAEQVVLVEHLLLAVHLLVGVGKPVVPDERHPLYELLVGADHTVKPPAVVLAPGVGGGELVAFVIDRFRAAERRRSGGPGEAVDDLAQRLSDKRLGLPGGRPEARAPAQTPRLCERDRRTQRFDRGGGGRRRRGRGAGQRDRKRAVRLRDDGMVDMLAALVLVPALVVLGVLVVLLVVLLLMLVLPWAGIAPMDHPRYVGRNPAMLAARAKPSTDVLLRDIYVGSLASERHRYRHASVRYGRHGCAISSIAIGSGSPSSP